MTVQIEYLKNYKEYSIAVSQWAFDTWSKYNSHATRKSYIEKYKGHCQSDSLPLTLIALTNNVPVGMCSLRENDGIRPDLTPWLGSLYVLPRCRGQGIGEKLITAAKQVAHTMGYNQLYLLTFEAGLNQYYARLNWKMLGNDRLNNFPVSIMELTFEA